MPKAENIMHTGPKGLFFELRVMSELAIGRKGKVSVSIIGTNFIVPYVP